MSSKNYGTSLNTEEKLDAIQLELLPRSVVRKNQPFLLDGEWNFSFDQDDHGLAEQWYLNHNYQGSTLWPESIETLFKKAKGEKVTWQDKIVVWYEKEVVLDSQFITTKTSHSILQLTFGACGYETRLWLNGNLLRTIEEEEIHTGEYTSFSYELPDEYLQNINRFTVRIEDTMDADITRGKQESHIYKRGGIWYQTNSGAVRSLWLEWVDRNRLRSRVGIVSNVEDYLVRVSLTTRIHDEGNYLIRLNVFELNNQSAVPYSTSDFPIFLSKGQKNQRLVIEMPGAKLWSPHNPNLYRFNAQLIDNTGYLSEIETEIGLRKVEARGCCIYLNNQFIYLDGILYQPGGASYEQMKTHFLAIKKLGCNLVRIHIAGVDPRIYNLADKIGLLLWIEVPSPHQSSEKSRANHHAELLRMLALIGTHPSIIIWSLYNEDWGVQDIATNYETRKYIIDTYHFMQIAYPQFLVVDNDGWQHISFEGRLKSDLLSVHLYTPELSAWKEMLNKLIDGQLVGVAAFPLVVGDPFFYRRQIPLVISEWGGFGFPDYGGPTNAEERMQQIKNFKQELRKRTIAGDVYTQATDIEDEQNGLIDTATGELKVDAGLLCSK